MDDLDEDELKELKAQAKAMIEQEAAEFRDTNVKKKVKDRTKSFVMSEAKRKEIVERLNAARLAKSSKKREEDIQAISEQALDDFFKTSIPSTAAGPRKEILTPVEKPVNPPKKQEIVPPALTEANIGAVQPQVIYRYKYKYKNGQETSSSSESSEESQTSSLRRRRKSRRRKVVYVPQSAPPPPPPPPPVLPKQQQMSQQQQHQQRPRYEYGLGGGINYV